MATRDMQMTEKEIAAARRDVEGDIAALGSAIRDDERMVKNRVRSNAPAIAGGAAALGLLVGFGGARAVKLLVGLGLVAAGVAMYAKKQNDMSPAERAAAAFR